MLTIAQIAAALGIAPSTIHRWLNDGIIAGEQFTPGAPWRIRLTDDLRARVAEDAPDDYLTVYQTMRVLGVSICIIAPIHTSNLPSPSVTSWPSNPGAERLGDSCTLCPE